MVEILMAAIGSLAAVVVIAVAVCDDVLVNAVVAALDVVFVVLARIEHVEVNRVTLIITFLVPLFVACLAFCSCGSPCGCCSFLLVGRVLRGAIVLVTAKAVRLVAIIMALMVLVAAVAVLTIIAALEVIVIVVLAVAIAVAIKVDVSR